jgi:hypothetical protein
VPVSRCGICGRRLVDGESIARGFGPGCWRELHESPEPWACDARRHYVIDVGSNDPHWSQGMTLAELQDFALWLVDDWDRIFKSAPAESPARHDEARVDRDTEGVPGGLTQGVTPRHASVE